MSHNGVKFRRELIFFHLKNALTQTDTFLPSIHALVHGMLSIGVQHTKTQSVSY